MVFEARELTEREKLFLHKMHELMQEGFSINIETSFREGKYYLSATWTLHRFKAMPNAEHDDDITLHIYLKDGKVDFMAHHGYWFERRHCNDIIQNFFAHDRVTTDKYDLLDFMASFEIESLHDVVEIVKSRMSKLQFDSQTGKISVKEL